MNTSNRSVRFARRVSFLALGAIALGTSPAVAGLDNSVWPMFQHDPQHSGRATVNGPQGPTPQVDWDYRSDSRVKSSPTIGSDGTIYLGNGKRPLTALDPDTGTEIWNANVQPFTGKPKAGLADHSQPAVSDDGRVFMGARDNNFWAFFTGTEPGDTAGDVDWTYHVPHDGDVTVSATIAQDGTVYLGSEALGAGWFYAMNPDGTFKWPNSAEVEDGKVILRGSLKNISPALNLDESIVYVSTKRDAIAYDTSNGHELWRREIADKGFGSLAPNYTATVSNDGQVVYFISKEGLWAFDAETGADVWDEPFVPPFPEGSSKREELKSAPSIGADGTIYVGASKAKASSHFYALNPADGSVEWAYAHTTPGAYINNQAAIGADGTIYVGLGITVFAFNPNGTLKWSMLLPGKMESGPVIGGDGVLYIGASKRLFKITD